MSLRVGADATEQRDALLGLLRRDLRLGQRRLALRRWLMLQACGHAVPSDVDRACHALAPALPQREVDRIRERVSDWLALVGQGASPRVREPVPSRTVWRWPPGQPRPWA